MMKSAYYEKINGHLYVVTYDCLTRSKHKFYRTEEEAQAEVKRINDNINKYWG